MEAPSQTGTGDQPILRLAFGYQVSVQNIGHK